MKEKELRNLLGRAKTNLNVSSYEINVQLTDHQGELITGKIFELHTDHNKRTLTIVAIEIK